MPFNSTINPFTTSEDNHADTFNERLTALLENDNYLNDNMVNDPHGNESHSSNFITDYTVTNLDLDGLSNSYLLNDAGFLTDYTVTNADLDGLSNAYLVNGAGYLKDFTVTNSDLTGLNNSELNNDSGYLTSNSQYIVPSGGIIMWSGAIVDIPTGWTLCDGTDGTPNLQDRFIVGAGNTYAVGDIGGADSITLTESQMPAHNHSDSYVSDHNHSSGGYDTDTEADHTHFHSALSGTAYTVASGTDYSVSGSGSTNVFSSPDGTHSHDVQGFSGDAGGHSHTISNTGGGTSHENRPPFYSLAYIMKL